MIPTPIPALINHLLAPEPWAREKLARHSGKTAVFDAGLLSLRLKIAADGMVETAAADAVPDVTIRARMADLPLMAQNREQAFSYVQIDGDADFAHTISQLAQSLRWEAEADLGRVVGDVAAVRIVGGARDVFAAARTTQRKLAENLAEYFTEENPVLVRPHAVNEFSAEVNRLRDDVERLAKRIEKLKGSR